jgi:hypothetical protein
MFNNILVQIKKEKHTAHTVVLLFCTVDSLTVFVPYYLIHSFLQYPVFNIKCQYFLIKSVAYKQSINSFTMNKMDIQCHLSIWPVSKCVTFAEIPQDL